MNVKNYISIIAPSTNREQSSPVIDNLNVSLKNSPDHKTLAAIKELEEDGGKSFSSIDELMADLNSDD